MKAFYFLIISLLASIFFVGVGRAQDHGHHRGHKILEYKDSTRTLGHDFLDKGTFEFHKRSFFMSTINKGELLNYSALASGAGIGYYSPSWKNFHFGFSGFFVFQLFENNIYEPDPTTDNTNRYEILLFDMNDLTNKHDLDRLEELYLTYEREKLNIIFGRQKFNSPFLNEQDNRMRANLFNGVNIEYKLGEWDLTAAVFNKVTIRGTVDWYTIEDSYGVYPFGRSPFGVPSQYKGNVKSRGIGVLGAQYNKNGLSVEAWNYFNENVFNMSFVESLYSWDIKKTKLFFGGQGFYQTAVNYGGNKNQSMAYILKDEWTYGLGSRVGFKKGNSKWSLNYLHIANEGRFLFPREWGREQFFTSLPRERYEGSGAVNAVMLKYEYELPEKGWSFFVGASAVNHSELSDYRMNKYGVPSYFHFVASADYKFKGYLKGLEARVFVANKTAQNPDDVPDQFRINRVDLWNMNVVVDYRF